VERTTPVLPMNSFLFNLQSTKQKGNKNKALFNLSITAVMSHIVILLFQRTMWKHFVYIFLEKYYDVIPSLLESPYIAMYLCMQYAILSFFSVPVVRLSWVGKAVLALHVVFRWAGKPCPALFMVLGWVRKALLALYMVLENSNCISPEIKFSFWQIKMILLASLLSSRDFTMRFPVLMQCFSTCALLIGITVVPQSHNLIKLLKLLTCGEFSLVCSPFRIFQRVNSMYRLNRGSC
jgi:hypothetical protein